MLYSFCHALTDLFTLRAFRPGVRDSQLTLQARLRGESVLLVGFGSRMLRTARMRMLQDEGILSDHQLTARPAAEVLSQYLAGLATSQAPKARHAVALLSHGWSAELQEREDPEMPGGNTDHVHFRVGHPTLACGVLFRLPRAAAQEIVDIIGDAGLQLCRLQVPVITLLDALVRHAPSEVSGADVLIADFQSLLFITCEEGRWARIRFSSNRPGDLAADIARHLRERSDPSTPLVVAGGGGLAKLVRAVQPEAQVRTPLGETETVDLHAACQR